MRCDVGIRLHYHMSCGEDDEKKLEARGEGWIDTCMVSVVLRGHHVEYCELR